MIAFLACLAVLLLSLLGMYVALVRPLRRKLATLKRTVGAESVWNNGQHKLRRDEVKAPRRLSGEEAEALSERLGKVEERKTVTCEMN
jgi:threonine dehydrogenase-like Zn-dependent dehydrogenase